MKVKSVKYGLPLFGPMVGQRGLIIELEDSDEGVPFAAPENRKDLPLYKEFREALKAEGIEQVYRDSLSNQQATFHYWKGGAIERLENSSEFDLFYALISHDAIEEQSKIIGMTKDGKIKDPGQLRPPFAVFIGSPQVFSASRDFYQRFNFVIPTIDCRPNFVEPYSDIALREMLNHQNGQVMYFIDDKSQLEQIPTSFKIRKVSVLNMSDDQSLAEICANMNWRYYHSKETWICLTK